MAEHELVSIVTMTYKNFKGLRKTMDSVLRQDYPRIEYIVADDCSPAFDADRVRDYIMAHKGPNVKNVIVMKHEENVGTVKNLNRAYQAASGTIVMPLSCGDYFWQEDVVSRIVQRFHDTDANAIVTRRVAIDMDTRKMYYIPDERSAKKLVRMQDDKCGRVPAHIRQYRNYMTKRLYDAASGSVLALKRNRLEGMGWFDEDYRLLEDSPFFLKFLYEEPLCCAMDIVSIGYATNGVSGKTKNPILVQDDIRVIRTAKQEHLDALDPVTRDWVKNEYLRTTAESKGAFMRACALHPVGFTLFAGQVAKGIAKEKINAGR